MIMISPLLIFIQLLLALEVAPLFILLPLYLYPGSKAAAWSNITSTIAAYPHVQWQIIVNPSEGPGPGPHPSDTDYLYALTKLNSYPNVKTLGYVDLLDTRSRPRSYSQIIADVDIYASWATSYRKSNISVAGIFFDDVSSAATPANYQLMHNISAYAYARVPSAITPVVFNPGDVAPKQLFDYCDTMVEFEDAFAKYRNESTIRSIPAAYRGRSAIIVHSTPVTAKVKSLVHTMAREGIEAVYLGGDCCYQAFSKVLLTALAAAVQAG